MPTHTLDELLDATSTSIATFTYGIDEARLRGASVRDIAGRARRLGRTLARLEVLAVMHPELTADDAVPRGAVPDAEWEAWAAEGRVLDQLLALPSAPATVTIHATAPDDADEAVQAVLDALNGSVIAVRSTYDGPVVDLGPAVAHLS